MIISMNKSVLSIASVVAVAATGCTSYEIDMPSDPDAPVVGSEVSTEVVYQANPRFFGENECLKGLDAQLSRISDMGCDILWVMPVYVTGDLNSIGSPYCVRDFKAVNPKYGTIDDLRQLVENAHAKGMKVILDWIANHTSWDHPWISEHPDRYEKDADGKIISPQGWADVAQLDFNNPATREAMVDAMTYWVREAGVDGFRCDYAEGVPPDFWSEVIADLRNYDSNIIMLAETGDPEFYSYGFDMIYDWSCATAISAAFDGGKPADVVNEAEEALAKVPDGKSILRFAFNHDIAAENAVDMMFGSAKGVPAAYVLAAMLNGTPMIYSSMDCEGLTGKLSFFDYRTLEFSTQLTEVYQKINHAFRYSADIRRGELRDYSNSSAVCFTRAVPGHNLLVAVNTTASTQTVKSPISLAGTVMTDLIEEKSDVVPVVIELEPYGYKILMN